MRAILLATPVLAGAVVLLCSGADARSGQLVGPGLNAPIGHFQPRTGYFSPGSKANESEQERLSRFNDEQKKQDESFDKQLSICRC